VREGVVDAAGGRVLTVAATGSDLGQARERAYEAVAALRRRLEPASFICRGDIAERAAQGATAVTIS
jgi:phosphoribosylamine--glycine ligase